MEFLERWKGEHLERDEFSALQTVMLQAGFLDKETIIKNDVLTTAEVFATLESFNLKVYRLANGAGLRCAGWMLWSPRANSGIDAGGVTVLRFIHALDPKGHGWLEEARASTRERSMPRYDLMPDRARAAVPRQRERRRSHLQMDRSQFAELLWRNPLRQS